MEDRHNGRQSGDDSPADKLTSMNRVSIRAVLAAEGEDVADALARAGILNPVAIPVLLDDDGHPSGVLFGDGFTPNLTGVLELDDDDDDDDDAAAQLQGGM
jgi:hypothetical protein